MKIKILLIALLFLSLGEIMAQTKPKEKPPTQSEIDKMMDDATKDMSDEEKAEMKKMMKGMMPEMTKKPGSVAVSFSDNRTLIPPKDINRINSIPRKIFTEADVTSNTALLYGKLIVKIPASEKAIITNVLSKAKNGSAIMEASVTSFMQGHNQAAMGLALKALQADPKNANHQNNLAAILSQSGYPEKAIPYFNKLSRQFPDNSTVLHNLGYAWLSLGETDSAQSFFAHAVMRNPKNPETKLCLGVIEELKGDPKRAADNYVESFEEAPNPFTENMVRNVNADDRLEKIDFDKLKKHIVIYEYFKRGWIKIPALSDKVSTYETDRSIKNGYNEMFDKLNSKIATMTKASGIEATELLEEDTLAFTRGMLTESINGLSMMSMPAVYVQKILQAYLNKWNKNYIKEGRELMEKIDSQKQVMTKIEENDKCPDHDFKNNEFMAYANPLIRKFYANKIEEFRVWLNAYCTWSWYIAGNPVNVVMSQCIAWTGFITSIYERSIEDQYAISKSCVNQDDDGVTYIPVPAIPNFNCPAVVSIPVGLDEFFLDAGMKNFDNNDWDIQLVDGVLIPNVTLSLGVDNNDITEPGMYGNLYVKTGNGSINVSGNNNAPNTIILNKKNINSNEMKKLVNAQLTRKLVAEMMKTKCPGEVPEKKKRKAKFEVGLATLELVMWDAEKKAWVDEKTYNDGIVQAVRDAFKEINKPRFEVGLGKLELEDPDMQAWNDVKGDKFYEDIFKIILKSEVSEAFKEINKPRFEVGLGELELEDPDMQAWDNVKGDEFYEDAFKIIVKSQVSEAFKESGLQTAIINGLEGIKAMGNFDRGLFE
jgi:tetratricopeptide (TPR) repeat protein